MPLDDQPNISSSFAESAKLSQVNLVRLLRDEQERAPLLQVKAKADQATKQKSAELRESRPARVEQTTKKQITKLTLECQLDGPGRPMTNADYVRIKSEVTKSTRVADARAIKQVRKEGREQIEKPLREAERRQAERQARVQAILDQMRGSGPQPHTRNHKRT
jgi:hypothetical protein